MTEYSKKSLDERIADYYHGLSMDPAKLQSLVHDSSPQESVDVALIRRRRFLKVASTGAVVVTAAAILSQSNHPLRRYPDAAGGDRDHIRLVAELVSNHRSDPELDVISRSLGVIRNELDQVAFTIDLPTSVLADYQIVGGRYCSLLNQRAVLLRLHQHAGARPVTAFVTSNSPKFKSLRKVTIDTDDLTIHSLIHDDLFVSIVAER